MLCLIYDHERYITYALPFVSTVKELKRELVTKFTIGQ